MTDREMLELAARAAGIEIRYWTEDSSGEIPVAVLVNGDFWQPLLLNTHTDCMGDALRLAVALGMRLDLDGDLAEASASGCGAKEQFYERSKDKADAARRAIVRCAAKIGKKMEPPCKS